MVRKHPFQLNFGAGQLSPTYSGNRGETKYYQGAKLLQNVIPLPNGVATRRPPTRHIDNFATFENKVLPFQSAPSKSYVIKIELDASNVFFTIFKRSSGVTSQVHSFSSSLSNNTDDWSNVKFSQSRDVMYLAFPGEDTPVKKLTRLSDTSWTFANVQEIDGPWDELNTDADLKMDASGQSGPITIQAQNKGGGTPVNYFDANDVGKLIRLYQKSDPDNDQANYWGCAIIDSLAGAAPYHTVNATVQSFTASNGDSVELTLGANSGANPTATKNWRLGAINAENGYPSTISFYQNRLVYGRGNRVMGSMGNDFERHSPTVTDGSGSLALSGASTQGSNHSQTPDSAFDFKLLDLRAEKINWLHADQVLHIGTNDGRYILSTGNKAIDTTQGVGVVRQSNIGCSSVQPVTLDDTIYSNFNGQSLHRTDYNFRRDRFEDKNLNLYSDQILKGGVTKLAVSTYPFNIVWTVTGDGKFQSLTYDAEQEVLAWAEHQIKNNQVVDMVSLKAEDEVEVLYLVVKSAANVYSLQELDLTKWDYRETSVRPNLPLIDGYKVFSSTASLTGIQHLNGETPIAMQNGINYNQTGVVSSGNFTLADSISGDFEVGLPMEPKVITFPIQQPVTQELEIGQAKDINECEILLFRTGSVAIKTTNSRFDPEPIKFRTSSDPVGQVPPLFTGQKEVPISSNSENELIMEITQPEQAPLTILGLEYRVEVQRG